VEYDMPNEEAVELMPANQENATESPRTEGPEEIIIQPAQGSGNANPTTEAGPVDLEHNELVHPPELRQ
jgi:hypothetical protein